MQFDTSHGSSAAAAGLPLQPLSRERSNQQQNTLLSSLRSELQENTGPGAPVHDKIGQFNSLAMQSRQLERKTADAALKRAMIYREEAESEMRLYRDETRALRRQVEECKEREKKVGERLETVMENYGRAKETHAHTQSLWEKEIRRTRKDTFKAQSTVVNLQEELRSARATLKTLQDALEQEKKHSQARGQEAFSARYEFVGVQEKLEQALERVKAAEAERDAFRTIAKNEEVARMAAEERIPPPEEGPEFASSRKARPSLSQIELASPATAAEAELEELALKLEWERRRADRAIEMADFLEVECRFQMCLGSKIPRRRSMASPLHRNHPNVVEIADPSDLAIIREGRRLPNTPKGLSLRTIEAGAGGYENNHHHHLYRPLKLSPPPKKPKKRDEGRRSTIFCAREGIFRTVSQQEADEIHAKDREAAREKEEPRQDNANGNAPPPVNPPEPDHREYARSPSADPPACAITNSERVSLQSLLNAPHQSQGLLPSHFASIPTAPDSRPRTAESSPGAREGAGLEKEQEKCPPGGPDAAVDDRPHTTSGFYSVSTTTTRIPLRSDNAPSTAGMPRPPSVLNGHRTPSSGSTASFDVSNPAMTPTMTREEALAQIRERRGRVRSAVLGHMTPRKKMVEGAGEAGRNVSAPAGRVGGGGGGGGGGNSGVGRLRL